MARSVEDQHQAVADPAGLEPAMGVRGLLGRVRVGHQESHLVLLGQASQTVELLPLFGVGGDNHWRDPQPPLTVSGLARECGHRPTVARRRQDGGVEQGAVGQAVDAVRELGAEPIGEVGAAPDQDVRAGGPDQVLVGLGGIRDHGQAATLAN
jgi:hypothetical protein